VVVVVGAGAVVVVGAVVGACTAGSDFSPHPVAATAATTTVPANAARSRSLPAIRTEITPGTVTNRVPEHSPADGQA